MTDTKRGVNTAELGGRFPGVAPRMIFPLKYAVGCLACGAWLEPGTMARRSATDKRFYYCLTCAPVTTLPPGTAEGAHDSSKASLKAATVRGKALRTGVPQTPSKNPKRKRLTGNQRLARAMRAKPSE